MRKISTEMNVGGRKTKVKNAIVVMAELSAFAAFLICTDT
jgi:hypothetical protein